MQSETNHLGPPMPIREFLPLMQETTNSHRSMTAGAGAAADADAGVGVGVRVGVGVDATATLLQNNRGALLATCLRP